MPNIAVVLKQEIARVARKELRAQTDALKKTVTSLRSEVSALKRRAQALEAELRQVVGTRAKPVAEPAGPTGLRFTAKGLATNRKRLGLSAADFGLLVGTTGQSIYAWERGSTQPRARHLAAISDLRGIGKKEAAARLAALRESA